MQYCLNLYISDALWLNTILSGGWWLGEEQEKYCFYQPLYFNHSVLQGCLLFQVMPGNEKLGIKVDGVMGCTKPMF